MKQTPAKKLMKKLQRYPKGKLDDDSEVMEFLCDHWNDLRGSDDTKMKAEKLYRIENLKWVPPSFIEFEIERHGATVNGSVYGEVYTWSVDLETMEAGCGEPKKVVIGERDKPLNVKTIAEHISKEILNSNYRSEYLKWLNEGKVRVLVSGLIPHTNNWTTSLEEADSDLNFQKYCQ